MRTQSPDAASDIRSGAPRIAIGVTQLEAGGILYRMDVQVARVQNQFAGRQAVEVDRRRAFQNLPIETHVQVKFDMTDA